MAGWNGKRDRAAQAELMRQLNGRPGFHPNRNKGRVYSRETKQRIAEGVAKAHVRGDYWKGPTNLELALRRLLCGAGFEFEEQVRMGRYVVDAYVPEFGLVFEADCMFWYSHQDTEREARRDAYLMGRGVAAVIHLTEEDLY